MEEANPPEGSSSDYVTIPPSENDSEFRRIAKQTLDSAKSESEVVIITGELTAAFFPELKQSAFDALERGVKVLVYATHPVQDLLDEIVRRGVEVHLGSPIKRDHYMVVNRRTYIISQKETAGATMIGTRHGRLYPNDPVGASKIMAWYEEATGSLKRKTKSTSVLVTGGLGLLSGAMMMVLIVYEVTPTLATVVAGSVIPLIPSLVSIVKNRSK